MRPDSLVAGHLGATVQSPCWLVLRVFVNVLVQADSLGLLHFCVKLGRLLASGQENCQAALAQPVVSVKPLKHSPSCPDPQHGMTSTCNISTIPKFRILRDIHIRQ